MAPLPDMQSGLTGNCGVLINDSLASVEEQDAPSSQLSGPADISKTEQGPRDIPRYHSGVDPPVSLGILETSSLCLSSRGA